VRIDPPGELFPSPRPFFWLPADGARHAIHVRDRDVVPGELVSTLCGKHLTRIIAGDTEWLWPTCPECWDAAAKRVGLRS
jgi:hypothetical protein